jgi:hypothetical protein
MKIANYFCDGYTQPGFIAAAPRLHGELRFTFRPALVEERSQLVDAAGRLKSDAYDRQAAAFLAQKLVAWELVDGEGRGVAVSAAALLRLHPELFVKLHRIVLGWMASDVDPRWTEEAIERAAEEQYESALSGKSVGEVRQERDEKN